jgi:hypothetical protein
VTCAKGCAIPGTRRRTSPDAGSTTALATRSGPALPDTPGRSGPIFLTEDFAAGTFGDPLRYTLCVFGADLLRTLGPALSSWLPTRWTRR